MEKETGVKKSIAIAIDFDGTCVTNENFPGVGEDIGAVPILKEIKDKGNKLILWTVRDDISLANALRWFDENEIKLDGVNKYKGGKSSSSPKLNADIFIDDKALGAPLISPKDKKPYINWSKVRVLLKQKDII